ncbi:TetR/AcrR family transcriptional regulator [Sphingobacterium sp. UT-1RO-CII-1]|uniref:TetR/AcrR family transcriptional regulator n=1 Tax=Sphingobacterium sp. UT-1RO-CII-1 TaxID=2995225 RepID=UPI00227D2FC9|nr:TetR/AcrR family transcriptional regulator [Sphingobacterium sp. UT-1RO-CII-1]
MGKAEKTRQYIIEKTAPLFNTKGYAVTTVSDIIEVTGLTKGSIYGNFRDKDEVVVEAYKYNVSRLRVAMHAAIVNESSSFLQLLAMVEFYRNAFDKIMQEGGCPMLNAATESDDHLLFLKDAVQASFIGWHQKVEIIIQSGIHDGSFKTDIEPAAYASTFMMLIEGGILLSRTLGSNTHLSIALDRIIRIIEEEIKN